MLTNDNNLMSNIFERIWKEYTKFGTKVLTTKETLNTEEVIFRYQYTQKTALCVYVTAM